MRLNLKDYAIPELTEEELEVERERLIDYILTKQARIADVGRYEKVTAVLQEISNCRIMLQTLRNY